jgi:hypothetical protein
MQQTHNGIFAHFGWPDFPKGYTHLAEDHALGVLIRKWNSAEMYFRILVASAANVKFKTGTALLQHVGAKTLLDSFRAILDSFISDEALRDHGEHACDLFDRYGQNRNFIVHNSSDIFAWYDDEEIRSFLYVRHETARSKLKLKTHRVELEVIRKIADGIYDSHEYFIMLITCFTAFHEEKASKLPLQPPLPEILSTRLPPFDLGAHLRSLPIFQKEGETQ